MLYAFFTYYAAIYDTRSTGRNAPLKPAIYYLKKDFLNFYDIIQFFNKSKWENHGKKWQILK